jgi:formylglycine-generating enzyme required for sulfatase activity
MLDSLLTGKTPDQFEESLKKGLQWQGSAQGYSRELKGLIDWLMCPDLDDRPANAQEILKKLVDLEGCDQGQTSTPLSAFLTKSKPNVTTIQSVAPLPPPLSNSEQKIILPTRQNLVQPSSFIEKLPDGVLLEMVQLLGGEFLMGSPNSDPDARNAEKPQHRVRLSCFAIGKYPVTQAQYQAVMGTNPSYFPNNPQNPVEQVSWEDAQAFCQKLSQMTGKTYRLPTEAEWEYACRAGTTTCFYFGDDEKQLGDYAWYNGNSGSKTYPVGQKKPNAWGLYDMSGHVWEWCADPWYKDYRDKPDPIKNDGNITWSDTNNPCRVLCGGSWVNNQTYCRSAIRYGFDVNKGSGNVGFRLAVSVF